MKKTSVLELILKDARTLKNRGQRSLAVFDLDSTLFDLTLRVQKIILKFAEIPEMRSRFPEACKALLRAEVAPQDWGLREALSRVGLFEQEHPEFFAELHRHWAFYFFSNDYLHEDQPLPGAVEFVKALESENAQIMYLTGRDQPRMFEGTVRSLRAWGFPLDREHVRLVLKPAAGMHDAEFKLEVIRKESEVFEKVWLFENEPVNLNLIQKHCPEVELIFIETTHSGREQVAAELARIPHFEVDLRDFAKFEI